MMQTVREVGPLADEYKELGRKIQKLVAGRVNRLLAYVRTVKGQYWLDEIPFDELNPGQFFFGRTVAAIDGIPIKFDPDRSIIVTNAFRPNVERMVTAQDWPDVRKFVTGESRPPLVESLLANARRLAEQGSRRNAIVEAVTALEVALGHFSRRANANKLERFMPALEVASIDALIAKVGLRGAFGIVIPLLFSEGEFAASLLETCRSAIEQRNNVVHNGARDVDSLLLDKMILAIESSCRILGNYSSPKDND